MIRTLLHFLIVSVTLADSLPCPYLVNPVCGSDGELYYSECSLKNRNNDHNDVSVVSWADCQIDCSAPRACVLLYNPRCGSDGKIYGNKCPLLWASCGKSAPIVEEPLINCIDKKCPDNCDENDADCNAEVIECRAPWERYLPKST